MKPNVVRWRAWVVGGFVAVIAFSWASEIIDLPHLLLGAPSTPVNWQESLLESVMILFAAIISWELVRRYEQGWLAALEEVRQLAITDDLTGALNRRECMVKAEAEFKRAIRFNRPFVLAIIDFDNFKSINDLYGHPMGDAVLKEFAGILRANIRAQDLFGRMGGDEFMLALLETTAEEASQIIHRIRGQWEDVKRAFLPEDRRAATVSVGLVSAKAEDQTFSNCVRRADKALYLAKARGRNQICIG
jgi:diguanylate cyclase (GGDEF)-like protein